MHPLQTMQYCPSCGSKHFAIDTDRSRCCSDCGFTLYSNAAAAVAAIITDAKGRILLTTRAFDPAKGKLDLPGGFVDHNETAEQALRREIQEELGVEITDISYLSSESNIYPFGGLEVHTLDLFFTAHIAPNATLTPNDDVRSAQFYKLSNVIINEIGLPSIRKVLSRRL